MKQTKKGFVEVPQTTLNALKNMLFTNNEGSVDLSSIINDLTPNAESRDLTAINVALTYKGVCVDIDERPHYAYDYRNRFCQYDFCGYSLILGVVKCVRTYCELCEDGTIAVLNKESNIQLFDQWAEMTTDFEDIRAKIAKQTK